MKKGFTLIELLIVITIIGILAVALVPRIAQGPARARDVSRKADLQNISVALELYYSDNGAYPRDVAGTDPETRCLYSTGAITLKIDDYFQDGSVPIDPSGDEDLCTGTGAYRYRVLTDSNHYVVVANMEIDTGVTDGYYCNANMQNQIDTWDYLTDFTGDSGIVCSGASGENAYYIVSR